MTFFFFFNLTTVLLVVSPVLSLLSPANSFFGRVILYIVSIILLTLICWNWGRHSIRKRGNHIYIHNFPGCHKISASEIANLTIIEKHVLVNKIDGSQLKFHFMFGPSGGIHESVMPIIIDKVKRL